MVTKAEYDFFKYTSFPSSLKLVNDQMKGWVWWRQIKEVSVTLGATIKGQWKAKQENILYSRSHIVVNGWNGVEWKRIWVFPGGLGEGMPLGTFDWKEFSETFKAPSDITAIRMLIAGGAGSPEAPGITWFDDLKIFSNGVLIYENKFTGWGALISIPAPIVAGLGVVRFGKKG